MNNLSAQTPKHSPYLKVAAVLGMVFGAATVISGGNILFGSERAREMAGDYVPFVVWFNFLAGFVYIFAAVGVWLTRDWAFRVSVVIVAATGLTALAFGFLVLQGIDFETRTVGALALRMGFWTMIGVALYRAQALP